MFAKAKNINFDLANAVSEQIEKYERALKEADEEEEEDIDIYDYVDEEYHEILKDSEQYLGLISNIKPHPCGHLIYNGNIRREIGLIKSKSKTGKKEYLCTVLDGKWAEDYKFLKNDLLKVSVVELIYRVYDRIGVPMHDVSELISITKNDPKTWDIYAHGFTIGVNQVEQSGTRHRIAAYKPQNISELCAFIAAIRPGFKSMYKIFAERQPFNYGIPTFDKLIQTPEMPASFVLYQEMAMTALNFAGIPMTECYEIIKCISKKRVDRIRSFKDQFLKGFSDKIVECENKTKEESDKIAEMVWQIISDSAAYSFNASHSYCVSNDSLYGAYLKSHYPLEFYETFLRIMDEKGNKKDRMKAAQREAEKAFRIRFMPFRFRQDNRNIVADSKTNTITNTLRSIKGFGAKMGDLLYELKDNKYETFTDLLIDLEEKGIMCVKIESLIKIKYFNEFGENGKLLELYKEFSKGKCRYDKKHSGKTKIKRIEGLKEIEVSLPNTSLTMKDQLQIEREILGYIQMTYDVDKRFVLIMNLDTTYAPKIEFYCLKNAAVETWKIPSRYFKKHPIKAGDIIYLDKWTPKCKKKKLEDGSFEEIEGTQEWWLDEYTIKTEEFNNC
jgi:DNA polymerase III alpha subunit